MEGLRKQRVPVRKALVKTVEDLKAELENEHKTKMSVQQFYNRAVFQREQLSNLDRNMEQCLLETDVTEEELSEEYDAATEFVNLFSDVDVRVRNYFEICTYETEYEASVGHRNSASKSQYRLPKLEFKKFSGDAKDWLSFWSQFKQIHQDGSMAAEDKFQYLIQATVEGSTAREVVDSFPPSAENYPKVIQYLKERFGKDEILLEVYVRELLKLVLRNALNPNEHSVISNLYDKLETQLRALETLGVTSDKFAAMLYPLVESCLPEDVIRVWERNRSKSGQGATSKDRLSLLMEFLKGEVDGELRIAMARTGFGVEAEGTKKMKTKVKPKSIEEIPTATDLFNGQQAQKKCIFCDKGHFSQDCFQAPKMKLEDKKKAVQEKKACFICLKPGHISKKCKANIRCQVCEKKHFVAMCPDIPKGKSEATEGTVLSTQSCSNEVMLQTLLVRVSGPNGNRVVRALVDPGSQRSYLSEKAARVLGLESVGTVELAHNLFGGERTKSKVHKLLNVKVGNICTDFTCTLSVLDQPLICGSIPRLQNSTVLSELRTAGVNLTDKGDGRPDINLLIGADVSGKLMTGRIVPTKAGPVAVETTLGWTVMGALTPGIPNESSSTFVTAMTVQQADIADLWKLDAIGITDSVECRSREDLEQAAMNYFEHSTRRLEDGRFEIALPWIEGHPVLPSNEEVAMKRLVSATKKLETLGRMNDYQAVLDDWLSKGIIEEVPLEQSDFPGHYLPHRAVIKENSDTTKIRPVFDASSKPKDGASLNECLEKGRNLLELIPNIIVGFRLNRIGVISDIEKAFLQISVKQEERDFLRFLWWEKGEKRIKKFRHCRVVFGVSSSPFLLAATLKKLLEEVPVEKQEMSKFLLKSLYVDNCVTSLSSFSKVKVFIQDAVQILSAGQFNLRGWIWNEEKTEVKSSSSPDRMVSVLGLLWNVDKDEMSLDLRELPYSEECVSKRLILSSAHKLFDPIGFACPVALYPKILLQETWKLKLGWDQQLPEELVLKFKSWRSQLPVLRELKIPRWFFHEKTARENWTLHVFTDASKAAYAAVVFIRAEGMGGVSVQLIQAKSRVAPVKLVSIPRLELLGCCIGARLAETVKKDLDFRDISTYYWTDSSNALGWIKRTDDWATFVGNRVREIRELTDPNRWRHIKGSLNPADLPSRGCSPTYLLKSLWWEGPDWLKSPLELWPKSEVNPNEEVLASERRKTVSSHLVFSERPWYAPKFNKYILIVRMLAWMHRYMHNLGNKDQKKAGDLTVDEIVKSELWLLKQVQEEVFGNTNSERKGLLKQMNVQKDDNGIWRLNTRVFYRNDTSLFRSPILLPSGHMIVQLLVQKVHEDLSHGGVQVVMATIREKFWLTKARKTVKQIVEKCKTCKRFNVKHLEAAPVPLPLDRVRDACVFEVVGIDLAGPLYLKDKPKGWVVVFTCAVYRAVHFELVSSLSTECFMQSLRRFISRRGRPNTIYTDNGTNFVGAANQWKNVDWDKISASNLGSSHVVSPIVWNFNPPSAPWWGGFWERIVRMVKQLLRKVLGKACLDFEEMLTVLCDCESVINSRPLTYLSEDSEDLVPLCPSMFLQEIRGAGVSDVDSLDAVALTRRLQYRQKLRADFRKRFRSEYLGMLVFEGKVVKQYEVIKPGDVVLVGSENAKRLDWPMARVLEVFPGKDGVVRVAKVRTSSGDLVRPIQRLYAFEVSGEDRVGLIEPEKPSSSEEHDAESVKSLPEVIQEPVKTTRCGRIVKKPNRINC